MTDNAMKKKGSRVENVQFVQKTKNSNQPQVERNLPRLLPHNHDLRELNVPQFLFELELLNNADQVPLFDLSRPLGNIQKLRVDPIREF